MFVTSKGSFLTSLSSLSGVLASWSPAVINLETHRTVACVSSQNGKADLFRSINLD